MARLAALPPLQFTLEMLLRSHPLSSDRRASLRKLAEARQAVERAAREAAHQRDRERQLRREQRRQRKLGKVLAGAGVVVARWRT